MLGPWIDERHRFELTTAAQLVRASKLRTVLSCQTSPRAVQLETSIAVTIFAGQSRLLSRLIPRGQQLTLATVTQLPRSLAEPHWFQRRGCGRSSRCPCPPL